MFSAARQYVPLYFSIWRNFFGLLKIQTRETEHRLWHRKPKRRLFRETTMGRDIYPHRFHETVRVSSKFEKQHGSPGIIQANKMADWRNKFPDQLTGWSWWVSWRRQEESEANNIAHRQSCSMHANQTAADFTVLASYARKAYANINLPLCRFPATRGSWNVLSLEFDDPPFRGDSLHKYLRGNPFVDPLAFSRRPSSNCQPLPRLLPSHPSVLWRSHARRPLGDFMICALAVRPSPRRWFPVCSRQ